MRSTEPIRFLVRMTLFVPLVGLVLLLNWICGQPPVRRLFTAKLDAAAEALVAGKTIHSYADMADLKPIWLEHSQLAPDVVVLGSSRVVQIPQEWFRPRNFLNLAMLAGDFADAVAIFQDCLETGKRPKLVLLELNPTLTFDEKSHVAPALSPHYRRALLHYGIFPPAFFAGPLMLDALRWDPQIALRKHLWDVSAGPKQGGYTMRPDGSADWTNAESRKKPDDLERDVTSQMHNLDASRRYWRTASQPGWLDRKILFAFLDDLHARGIRVVVVLVPVHPTAFDFYSRQGGYDDSWIRTDMAARGVTVIGSYSPSVANITREDFYDDVHVHTAVLHRLLRDGGIRLDEAR